MLEIPHTELVLTTARLCLRVLSNPIATATEKADMTKTLIDASKCNPGEILTAMQLEIRVKATRTSVRDHYQGA